MLNAIQEACAWATVRLAILGMISVVLLAACSPNGGSTTEDGPIPGASESNVPVLHDLPWVDEIKAVFNQDLGQPRVVLLLSPT